MTLQCVSQYNNEVFPDAWCKDINKPSTVLNCSTSDCAELSVGMWSECPCGGLSFKNRTLTCVRGGMSVDMEVCSQCFGRVSRVRACVGVSCSPLPLPPGEYILLFRWFTHSLTSCIHM